MEVSYDAPIAAGGSIVFRARRRSWFVRVLKRETAHVTAGFLGAAARDRTIRVKFADVETELTASAQGGTLGSGGAWGKAAKKIAKQVEAWVTTNRTKLNK